MTTNDFDPTINLIPFALLSADEQKIMKAWPHGWEYHLFDGWKPTNLPVWDWNVVYHGKPAPVMITTWLPIYGNGRVGFSYESHDEAINAANRELLIGILRLDITNGVASTTIGEVKK